MGDTRVFLAALRATHKSPSPCRVAYATETLRLRFGLKVVAIGFQVALMGLLIGATTFADRKRIVSTCGSRQRDGTRKPHEATRKYNIVRRCVTWDQRFRVLVVSPRLKLRSWVRRLMWLRRMLHTGYAVDSPTTMVGIALRAIRNHNSTKGSFCCDCGAPGGRALPIWSNIL